MNIENNLKLAPLLQQSTVAQQEGQSVDSKDVAQKGTLVGVFGGENVKVTSNVGATDLQKLLATLQEENEQTRANQLLAVFMARLMCLAGQAGLKDAALTELELKTQTLARIIENMKPTKEELEQAQQRKEERIKERNDKLDKKNEQMQACTDLEEQIKALEGTEDSKEKTEQMAKLESDLAEARSAFDDAKRDFDDAEDELSQADTDLTAVLEKYGELDRQQQALTTEIKDGLALYAATLQGGASVEGVDRKELELGVVPDEDPVAAKAEREEELKALGVLIDLFDVFEQSQNGVEETELKVGPSLQEMLDDIDKNTPQMV